MQVRDHILELTHQRKLQAGDQLPSEAELSQAIGVSRNTIREALMTLERDGMVVRRHGIGTFITPVPQHLRTSLHQVLPIPELIASSGFEPHIKNLKIAVAQAPSEAYEILQATSNDPLLSISLLYLADKRPAIHVTYWLIPSLNIQPSDWNTFDGHMINFVERLMPLRIHHTVARIFAVTATKQLADTLKVKRSSPLLKMVHTAYTADGQPIYCSTSYQDSDLLEVTVVRQRK